MQQQSMQHATRAVLFALVFGMLCGCGQMGPLSLPDDARHVEIEGNHQAKVK